jgi:hypothetical protein
MDSESFCQRYIINYCQSFRQLLIKAAELIMTALIGGDDMRSRLIRNLVFINQIGQSLLDNVLKLPTFCHLVRLADIRSR